MVNQTEGIAEAKALWKQKRLFVAFLGELRQYGADRAAEESLFANWRSGLHSGSGPEG